MGDRDFAVVVGINKYDAPAEFPELHGPTNDAEDMVAWLKDPAGGGLPPEHVDPFVVLSNQGGDKPTQSKIAGVLRDLIFHERPEDAPIGRRLYVFLAGHGFTNSVTLSLLHSVETRRAFPAYISGTQWLDCFHEKALFEELILCMDCCRDYEPTFDQPGRPGLGGLDAASNKVKRLYLLGTGIGKGAYERDFNGKTCGLFSRALIDALRDEAIDGDGRITADAVVSVIEEKLQPAAKAGLNLFPDPVITRGFVLFDQLKPRYTRVDVTPPAPGCQIEVFSGDDQNFSRPFAPSRTQDGVLTYDLPRRKTYMVLANNGDGRPIKRRNLTLRNQPAMVDLRS
jgi:hypothetical protein